MASTSPLACKLATQTRSPTSMGPSSRSSASPGITTSRLTVSAACCRAIQFLLGTGKELAVGVTPAAD